MHDDEAEAFDHRPEVEIGFIERLAAFDDVEHGISQAVTAGSRITEARRSNNRQQSGARP